jgi:hypothetical protein
VVVIIMTKVILAIKEKERNEKNIHTMMEF